MDTGVHPLVSAGLLRCPYCISSYTGPAVADTDPVYGIQMHHPRFLEFIGAPESARLLFRSLAFWVQNMDREDAVAAAINLQRDAGMMSSNLQILSQFVTSLQHMSAEVLSLAMGQVVFPSSAVATLSPTPEHLGLLTMCLPWLCGGLWEARVAPGRCRGGDNCMNCRCFFRTCPAHPKIKFALAAVETFGYFVTGVRPYKQCNSYSGLLFSWSVL